MNRTYLKLTLDLDFVLIAITAPLKDYRLGHLINSKLGCDFAKIEDHEIHLNNDAEPVAFSRYYFFVEQGEIEYYLIANRCPEGFLIPEMKEADFFILIKEFIDDEDLTTLITGLNRIQEVQVAVEIDPQKLKSRENLIF